MIWIAFNVFIILMITLDLFAHKKSSLSVKQALIWSGFWILLALGFNVLIYFTRGQQAALEFLTGYLIEESLSLDNLFVFLLIFDRFITPQEQLHRVLFWGVLGAIVMRALFIFGGIALVSHFHWLLYLFGAFLVLMGMKIFHKKDNQIHPEKNPFLLLLRKFLPITDGYRGKYFVVKEYGRWHATPLLVVLLTVEMTDLIFAFDSIPAIFAVTLDPFIVYTSNIFAILGLRSLFFALAAIMKLFHYLHYALGIILMFVGVKMLIAHWYKVPIVYTLAMIIISITVAALLSVLKKENSR